MSAFSMETYIVWIPFGLALKLSHNRASSKGRLPDLAGSSLASFLGHVGGEKVAWE